MRTEFLCISVLKVASGSRVKLAGRKSALNLPLPRCFFFFFFFPTDRFKAVVPVLVLLFVALWFILRGECFKYCLVLISSPEPKAHGELLWSLTVRRRRRRRRRRCRRRRRPDVRLSTIFKQHLLLNHWWEFDQTSQEWSLVGPLSKFFRWFRFIAYLVHRS